jgi:hypothetical protein
VGNSSLSVKQKTGGFAKILMAIHFLLLLEREPDRLSGSPDVNGLDKPLT